LPTNHVVVIIIRYHSFAFNTSRELQADYVHENAEMYMGPNLLTHQTRPKPKAVGLLQLSPNYFKCRLLFMHVKINTNMRHK